MQEQQVPPEQRRIRRTLEQVLEKKQPVRQSHRKQEQPE
jgi:hypothetical protein